MKLSDIAKTANLTIPQLTSKVDLPEGVTSSTILSEAQARAITNQLQPSQKKAALPQASSQPTNSSSSQPANTGSDTSEDLIAAQSSAERLEILLKTSVQRIAKQTTKLTADQEIDQMIEAYIDDAVYPEDPTLAQMIATLGELEKERRRKHRVEQPLEFINANGEFEIPIDFPQPMKDILIRSGTPIGQKVARMQLEAGK